MNRWKAGRTTYLSNRMLAEVRVVWKPPCSEILRLNLVTLLVARKVLEYSGLSTHAQHRSLDQDSNR